MTNHRYVLRREWDGALHPSERAHVNFIMLNPSTADDNFDDPTIRKCCGFAKRWSFSGIVVTNLFAYRATDPNELFFIARKSLALAIGEGNDEHILREANAAHTVVLAWGNHSDWFPERRAQVIELVQGRQPHMIRRTKSGCPAHPVREQYTDASVPYFQETNQ